MIRKELDPFEGFGKFELSGRKAEEQMAFYLRRFFGSSADVDVLNYLRIDLNGEVAQMDHLVLHPFGLLIVESKSVSDGVQITDDGQWMRWFNRKPSGMASPITQAHLQGKLLKELLEKTVKQKGFSSKSGLMFWLPFQTAEQLRGLSPGRFPRCARQTKCQIASMRG